MLTPLLAPSVLARSYLRFCLRRLVSPARGPEDISTSAIRVSEGRLARVPRLSCSLSCCLTPLSAHLGCMEPFSCSLPCGFAAASLASSRAAPPCSSIRPSSVSFLPAPLGTGGRRRIDQSGPPCCCYVPCGTDCYLTSLGARAGARFFGCHLRAGLS